MERLSWIPSIYQYFRLGFFTAVAVRGDPKLEGSAAACFAEVAQPRSQSPREKDDRYGSKKDLLFY